MRDRVCVGQERNLAAKYCGLKKATGKTDSLKCMAITLWHSHNPAIRGTYLQQSHDLSLPCTPVGTCVVANESYEINVSQFTLAISKILRLLF